MVLILGASGQLGTALTTGRRFAVDPVALSRADLDIRDAAAVDRVLGSYAPTTIINAAAYTAVDAAERDPDNARAVNAQAPGVLAAAAAAHGHRLVTISTDYVFSGAAVEPYEVSDVTDPATVYGKTKREGELAALRAGATVVRSAWVYGGAGSNFLTTMVRLLRTDAAPTVVTDQVGAPTYVGHLADAVAALVSALEAGRVREGQVWHFTNAGAVSWFEFAQAIFGAFGADPTRVRPVSTADYTAAALAAGAAPGASRPQYSVLSLRAWAEAGLPEPRPWRAGLADAIANLRSLP